jgi:hypothetical protein
VSVRRGGARRAARPLDGDEELRQGVLDAADQLDERERAA